MDEVHRISGITDIGKPQRFIRISGQRRQRENAQKQPVGVCTFPCPGPVDDAMYEKHGQRSYNRYTTDVPEDLNRMPQGIRLVVIEEQLSYPNRCRSYNEPHKSIEHQQMRFPKVLLVCFFRTSPVFGACCEFPMLED